MDGAEGDVYKFNELLKKKVQKGAEACNILIGQAGFLKDEQKIVAFVRLHEPITGWNPRTNHRSEAWIFLFIADGWGERLELRLGLGLGLELGAGARGLGWSSRLGLELGAGA